MSESTVVETPAAPAAKTSAPKKKASKTKSVISKSSHPKVSMMVSSAILNLKERGGSSLQAIKKYIASNYKVDAEKLAPFIRKHLKASVANGSLIQTKGKGATGSFKVSASKKEVTVLPKPVKKVTKTTKTKAPKAKKAVVKKVRAVKAAKPKKVTKVKVKKSPAKAPKPKKTMKAKGGKTKAPKQKK